MSDIRTHEPVEAQAVPDDHAPSPGAEVAERRTRGRRLRRVVVATGIGAAVLAAGIATGVVELSAYFGDRSIVDAHYEGNGVAFRYPAHWEEWSDFDAGINAGGAEPRFHVAVGYARRDLVTVTAYDFDDRYTIEDVREELDGLMAQLTGDGGAVVREPFATKLSGHDAYGFALRTVTPAGLALTSRFTVFVDGDTQYSVNCQHERHADQVGPACDTVLRTFRTS